MIGRAVPYLSLVTIALIITLAAPEWFAPLVILAFMSFAPGWSLMALLQFHPPGALFWIVLVTLSFAIDVVATTILLYAGFWTPVRGLLLIMALCISMASAARILGYRRSLHELPTVGADSRRPGPGRPGHPGLSSN